MRIAIGLFAFFMLAACDRLGLAGNQAAQTDTAGANSSGASPPRCRVQATNPSPETSAARCSPGCGAAPPKWWR